MTRSGLDPEVARAIAAAVGATITSSRAIGGGSISTAFALGLSDGREVFAKTLAGADPRMFPCEARGLAWIGDAVRVPRVVAVSDETAPGPAFLVLELVRPASRRRADYDERLGRDVAALHATRAGCYGLPYDNFIADLPQPNAPLPEWSEFYARRRLEPQVAAAIRSGWAPASWAGRFERLIDRLPDLVGPSEPPARLHGDLWSGNLHVDAHGAPCLIDPAVYGGCREIDLAMLDLFGSPGTRFWGAYDEALPRAPGARDRIALYQLYPLLVHVNLFGGRYAQSVEAALDRYL